METNEHSHIHIEWEDTALGIVDNQKSYWEVCGKKMTFGGKASHYIPMLKKFYDNYGGRAKLAAENQGIDWKAISHAFRVAFQTRRILAGVGFSYPLPETTFLRKIKAGELDYTTVVAPQLDQLMKSIEDQAAVSTLPEKVNVRKWDYWLKNRMWSYVREEFIPTIDGGVYVGDEGDW